MRVNVKERQRVGVERVPRFIVQSTDLHCSMTQHVHSVVTAKRNAVERHLARSVCGEDSPTSASSHTCLEAFDRGISMVLL